MRSGNGVHSQGFTFDHDAPIVSLMDALSVGASSLDSAELRLSAAAHNVANLGTEPFHPVQVVQQAALAGGSTARIEKAAKPASVDLVHQMLEQSRASIQYTASLRLIAAEDDLRGQLANLLA